MQFSVVPCVPGLIVRQVPEANAADIRDSTLGRREFRGRVGTSIRQEDLNITSPDDLPACIWRPGSAFRRLAFRPGPRMLTFSIF
jgi:hypothetical protein